MSQQPTCICINLRRAARAVSQIYDHALAEAGIKVTQFSLLRAIERLEPVAISALAHEIELDRTTLARNLAPLERERLIALESGADQRVTQVRLTRAGRGAIARALPLWQQAQAQFAAQLAQGRASQLRALAEEIMQAADRLGAAAPPVASKRKRRAKS